MKSTTLLVLAVLFTFSCGQGVEGPDETPNDQGAIEAELAARGIAAKVELDKANYRNGTLVPLCNPGFPCNPPVFNFVDKAQVKYTVTNTSKKAVSFSFTNGCRFDVTVFNGTGTVVRALGPVRFCTTNVSVLTLAPGESATHSEEVPMEALNGTAFEPGSYKVQVSLNTSSGSAAKASKTFTVSRR